MYINPEKSYLSQLMRGHAAFGEKAARRLEVAYGMDYRYLDGETPTKETNVLPGPPLRGRIPVISWVQAGSFSSVVDNFQPGVADETTPAAGPIRRHTYALRVRGDSMTNPDGPPTFHDGEIIVIEPDAIDSPDRLIGKFVVVKRARDDEATFKQLTKDMGVFYLKPLNPRYKIIEMETDDTICGVVVQKVVNY